MWRKIKKHLNGGKVEIELTTEQYEKYKEIQEEIKPVKKFLEWCGTDKYKCKNVGKYRFSLRALFESRSVALYRNTHFGTLSDNTYEIPEELQNRIIAVVENYVEEKEKELERI